MIKKGLIKRIAGTSLLVAALAVTGCSKADKKGTDESITATPATEGESEAGTVNPASEEDTEGNDNAEAEQLVKQAVIENLASNNVFHVKWYATDGDFESGTAFMIDSKTQGEKLLVTAFHFLCPEDKDSIKGSELPDYVLGGAIAMAASGEPTSATLKDCLVIEDAKAVPTVEKDVAAFSIQGGDDLKILPVCETGTKKGDKIYLLASLWDTDTPHENCVYEGSVISDEDGIMEYKLNETFSTKGASGAPIVNEYGEVVAIHMASQGKILYAHSAKSFLAQIDAGKFAGKEYPNDVSLLSDDDDEEMSEDNDLEIHNLKVGDSIDSIFFDYKINSIKVAETIGDKTAPEGFQYMVINGSYDGKPDIADDISMFAEDFWVEWGEGSDDEYSYPTTEAVTKDQLGDSYKIDAGKTTTGDLVFEVPKDVDTVEMQFLDYYTIGDSDDMKYDDAFIYELPVKDWSR